MLDPIKNFAIADVSTGYDDDDVSIDLASGKGALFPDPSTEGAFNVVWWNSTDYSNPSDDPDVEIVRVTARSTDTLTITRAQEDTSASAKNTGGKTYKIALTPTSKLRSDIIAYAGPGGIVVDMKDISAGDYVDIEMLYSGEITRSTLLANAAGDLELDIYVDTYANFPPTDADSIVASAPPSLSSASKNQDSTLTGWDVEFNAGDIMRVVVVSVSGITQAKLSLATNRI